MINPLIHGGKRGHIYLKKAAAMLVLPCIKIKWLKRRLFVGIFRPPSLK